VSGPATLTPAIIVGAIRYGETSRIVKLATPDLGVVSALAKGVQRPRSRFGASLQLLAEGTAHLLPTRGELALLTAFDPHDLHRALAASMEAFHAASALAELVAQFVPASPQPEAFSALRQGVALLEAAPEGAAETLSLAAIWRLVAELGFPPALEVCASSGDPIPPGSAVFAVPEGGLLCAACATGHGASRLEAEDRAALSWFLTGEGEPPLLDPPHLRAHRRLLVRWVARHLGEGHLPALDRWWQGR
jgi:DNA repair protein RecO (recombination protein O)